MTRRLSRKAPVWQAALAVVPLALALGVLLMNEPAEVSEPGAPARVRTAEVHPNVSGRAAPTNAAPRPLPPALAVVQFERGLDAASSRDLAAMVTSPARTPSERYVALRRLEREDPGAAVVEAEKVAMASEEGDDTFLALNALGALARHPGGRPSLRRCAVNAPSKAVRDAAARLAAR